MPELNGSTAARDGKCKKYYCMAWNQKPPEPPSYMYPTTQLGRFQLSIDNICHAQMSDCYFAKFSAEGVEGFMPNNNNGYCRLHLTNDPDANYPESNQFVAISSRPDLFSDASQEGCHAEHIARSRIPFYAIKTDTLDITKTGLGLGALKLIKILRYHPALTLHQLWANHKINLISWTDVRNLVRPDE